MEGWEVSDLSRDDKLISIPNDDKLYYPSVDLIIGWKIRH